jgi:hypothetical protein
MGSSMRFLAQYEPSDTKITLLSSTVSARITALRDPISAGYGLMSRYWGVTMPCSAVIGLFNEKIRID